MLDGVTPPDQYPYRLVTEAIEQRSGLIGGANSASAYSDRSPNGSPGSRDDNWPFFPSYNPLEYDPPASGPPASDPPRGRLVRHTKRIAVTAAWRTALFAVASTALYYLFVAHGWLVEVIR